MVRIAVTGASGFLGKHLIPALLGAGHEVRGLSRRPPSHGGWVGTASGFDFRCGDVRNSTAVTEIVDDCEWVIHLAASFNPDDAIADISVRGTENVVNAAKSAGTQRIVFLSCLGADAASSSEYFEAKWRAETLVRFSGLPHVIIRSAVMLGNGDGITRPLASAIRSAPVIPIPGDGRHRFQPVDVRDVVRCVITATSDDRPADGTLSVAGPMFLTFRQLVDLLQGEVRVNKPKILVPLSLLPRVQRLIPAAVRPLYQQPRLGQFLEGEVVSPEVVHREFGFHASNIVTGLSGYLV
jgi:uncharacterized protein YbjT (DUF2867 family)